LKEKPTADIRLIIMANLLTPISISILKLRNRIVLPPMWSGKATPQGGVTDTVIERLKVRAAGGCALVIVEHTFVHPRGRHSALQMGVHSDEMLDGLSRLASAVKAEGAAVALQITHSGSKGSSAVSGLNPVGPSAIPFPLLSGSEIPEELTVSQIQEIVALFGDAAVRTRAAGFDAVEIHAAHGFLLSEFLSPLTNRRTDEFGGTLKNRCRMALQVLNEVRYRLGPEFPVFVRLSGHDDTPGGFEVNDACEAAACLAKRGADLIDVSGGLQGARGEGKDPGYFVPHAAAVKARVQVPVLVAGGIKDPFHADSIVRSGQADLVGIGRAMLEDPEWAKKAMAALSSQAV
jgi:NADPH2 dehydrogenase